MKERKERKKEKERNCSLSGEGNKLEISSLHSLNTFWVTSEINTSASYFNVTRHGPLPALILYARCKIRGLKLSLSLQAWIYHVTAGRVTLHFFLSPKKRLSVKWVSRDATRLAESECDCSLNEQQVWINVEGSSWGVRLLPVIQVASFVLSQKEEATVCHWTAWYNKTQQGGS